MIEKRDFTMATLITLIPCLIDLNECSILGKILIWFLCILPVLIYGYIQIDKNKKESTYTKLIMKFSQFSNTYLLQYNDNLLKEDKLSDEDKLKFKKNVQLMTEQFDYKERKELKELKNFITNFDNESHEINSFLKLNVIPLLNILIEEIEKSEFKFSTAKHTEHLLLDKSKEDEHNRNSK